MTDPLEIFNQIVDEEVRKCGRNATREMIEKAVDERLANLPQKLQKEIEEARKRLSSYDGPGFHEHGPH